MRTILLYSSIALALLSCGTDSLHKDSIEEAHFTKVAPTIDGHGNDACWQNVKSFPMDQKWVGKFPHATDYMGKYKVRWDQDHLYILAEIYDDSLIDIHANGLEKYWDDDCLEIFLDEDHSGGNHQYNYNAFAYHISLDGKWVDIGIDSLPHYYNDHGNLAITHKEKITTWEVAVKLFPATYNDLAVNVPSKLTIGKKIGFAIAYNDNDKSAERESMMANIDVTPKPDKNRGWIDAGVFGLLKLIE